MYTSSILLVGTLDSGVVNETLLFHECLYSMVVAVGISYAYSTHVCYIIFRRQSKAHPPAEESTHGGGLPLPWKRVTIVLELIQQTSEIVVDVQLLPPHLFNLLNR